MEDSFYSQTGKRWFDFASAGIGMVLISPLLIPVALAVKLTSKGPVFFRQVRTGRLGRPFRIFKFRSMRTSTQSGSKLTASGDPRITPVGRLIRAAKIDELPQLLNVMMGEMSLVGPRPEVPQFTAHYTEEQRTVLLLRPGITGPSASVYEEELLATAEDAEKFYLATVLPAKLAIDLDYSEQITFSNDLHILLQTFAKLLKKVYDPYRRIPQAPSTELGTHASEK